MNNDNDTKTTNHRTERASSRRREWAIGAGAVLMCAIGLGTIGCTTQPPNTVTSETAAKAWAEKLKLPYRGAACTMFDSDDDGYVSCIVALDGPDRVYFQGLQCGEVGSRRGGGCKVDAKNPETKLVVAISPDGRAMRAPQ